MPRRPRPRCPGDRGHQQLRHEPGDTGAFLLNQRAGANGPFLSTNAVFLSGSSNALLTLGSTNQWRFYQFTNDSGSTNAAFLTFLPSPLTLTPMGCARLRAITPPRPCPTSTSTSRWMRA